MAKTHFNLTPAEYEAMREGHLQHRRRDLIVDALNPHSDTVKTVLEIGSGTGSLLANLAQRFPGIQFEGIDIVPEMVAYARERYRQPNLSYAVRDVAAGKFDRPYQLVFSIDVLHHVHDLPMSLRAIRGAMRAGGTWVVIEPNVWNPYIFLHQERLRRAGFDEDHFRPWRAEPDFAASGFAVASRCYRFLIPGFVKNAGSVLRGLEQIGERCPVLGGSVVYTLIAA